MKKKIISFALAIILIFPCLLLFAGCDGNTFDRWKIIKEEWESSFSVEEFYVHSNETNLLDNNELIGLSYKHYRGSSYNDAIEYSVTYKNTDYQNGKMHKRYYKEMCTQDDPHRYYSVREGAGFPVIGDDLTEITESEFNVHVAAYLDLINYISTNYASFTLTAPVNYEVEAEKVYSCDVAQINSQYPSISALNLDTIYVGKMEEDGIVTHLIQGKKCWILSSPNLLVKVFNRTNKFYIKGGPSTTDVDYGEYYFDADNGFRMYTPNNPVANRQDAYYKKVSGDTYEKYVKQTLDGSWKVTSATKNEFNTMINSTKDLYLGFMYQFDFRLDRVNAGSYFYKLNNKNSSYSQQIGALTYEYYDIEINATSEHVFSITWKMRFTNGQAYSAVYNMEFRHMPAGLTYPTV